MGPNGSTAPARNFKNSYRIIFYTRRLELMWEASCPRNNFCFCFKSFMPDHQQRKLLCTVLCFFALHVMIGPLSLFLLLSFSIWVFDALDLEKWNNETSVVSLQSLVIIDWHCGFRSIRFLSAIVLLVIFCMCLESHLDSCLFTFMLFHGHPWNTLCLLPESSVRCHLSMQKSMFCVSVYTHL